jgi:hypothetical protein
VTRRRTDLFWPLYHNASPSQCGLVTATVFGDPASFDVEHFHTVLIELIPTSLKDMLKLGDEHD